MNKNSLQIKGVSTSENMYTTWFYSRTSLRKYKTKRNVEPVRNKIKGLFGNNSFFLEKKSCLGMF